MLLLLPAPAALAGSGANGARTRHTGPPAGATHGPSSHVAEVGAGTNSNETNGNSGPKSKPQGNRTPPSPQASLCNTYKGAVRAACEQTVLSVPGPSPRRKSGS